MNTNETTNKYFLPAAVILAGLFIAGAVIWNGSHSAGSAGPAPTATSTASAVDIKNVKTDGEPYIGNQNAPVTIAEWSDYQCPFCKQFEVTTLPQIVQDYVSAGKVKVVFKDFSFLGPDSMVDAEYARAVWALYPEQFGAWRTALFSQEPQENSLSTAANLAFVLKVTGSVSGIDVNKVRQRDFDQRFNFLDYQVTTGHVTGYWQTGWKDVLAKVSYGQYLAGDRGYTVDVSKAFSNGVKMGAYFTRTNVSAEQFGEGSFDKGIYVSIPFDAFFTKFSNDTATILWNPLIRDGGAKLNRMYPLYNVTNMRDAQALSFGPVPSN